MIINNFDNNQTDDFSLLNLVIIAVIKKKNNRLKEFITFQVNNLSINGN